VAPTPAGVIRATARLPETVTLATPVTTTEAPFTDSAMPSSVAPSRSTVPLPSVSTSTVCRVSANSAVPPMVTGPAVSSGVPVMEPASDSCSVAGKSIASATGVGRLAPGSSVSCVPSPLRSKAWAQSIRP
jgi:hypothetical protein